MFTQNYNSIMRGFTKTINKLEARAVRNDGKVKKVEKKIEYLNRKGDGINQELGRCMLMADKMKKFLEV